jgi:hypothetical protein
MMKYKNAGALSTYVWFPDVAGPLWVKPGECIEIQGMATATVQRQCPTLVEAPKVEAVPVAIDDEDSGPHTAPPSKRKK